MEGPRVSRTRSGHCLRTGYTVGVDVFDRADNRSPLTTTTVSTAACPDKTGALGTDRGPPGRDDGKLGGARLVTLLGQCRCGRVRALRRRAARRDRQRSERDGDEPACGKPYLVGIDAADAAGNRSARVDAYYSTSACPTTNQPPSTPTGLKVAAATATSVTLAWTASSDDVAVAGYGLYVAGSRTTQTANTSAAFSGLQCGTTYNLGVDAYDNTGKRSSLAQLSAATSACASTPPPPAPGDTQPPAKPPLAGAGDATTLVLNWQPGSDNVGIDHYNVYRGTSDQAADQMKVGETTALSYTYSGLTCGTDYSLALVAEDKRATRRSWPKRSGIPCVRSPARRRHRLAASASCCGTVTQTIADGSSLSGAVNWRAVYDRNGDDVQDDPGSVRFLVDGNVVLTEQSMPFGDTAGFWASSSVTNGRHTFEVRAISDTGTVVATNTVTASIANDTSSPPPPPPPPPPAPAADTTAPSSPSSLRVVSATATSVTIAWNAATDNVAVAGYGLYRGSSQTGQTQQTTASYGMSCGTAYQVGVDAYDAAGKRSARANLRSPRPPAPTASRPPRRPTSPPRRAPRRASPSPGHPRPTTSASPATASTTRASSSTPPRAPPASSAASPAAPTTRSRSTRSTRQATPRPRPP